MPAPTLEIGGVALTVRFENAGAVLVQLENSDVLPSGAVAVAVMVEPGALVDRVCENVAVPLGLMSTSNSPTNVSPSPLPPESHAVWKTSRM